MNAENKICLYCQTPNDEQQDNCQNCGMPLSNKTVKQNKISFFIKAFWAIVLFCAFMIYFLPR